ncbi:MAG: signal peptidase I [Thermoleophilia bacterium]|nr:signal peptidase I [Thermoleophilia bacterium]
MDRLTAGLPSPWRTIVDWIVTIAVAVAAVLAIKAWVVNPYRIPSSSMEPTLHCAEPGPGCEARFSDRVLANRFIYHFKDPERGDIIVFDVPETGIRRCRLSGSETFVKRVVGLPGETIEGRSGRVLVDGKPLDEPYLDQLARDGITPFARRRIPDDEYFMMGDNRGQSCDSREWGPVPRAKIIGEVFAVYWPPQRIGFR